MDPEKLKVVELRTELSQRGLDTKGVKSVLVERLRKAIEEENANLGSQGRANTYAESTEDDMTQESDEKITKSTKVPQTPKKSSRLSKAVPVTPREDPATKKRRTARMSYSRRRTSPKKTDQNDMSREPSPVPSDSALQDEGLMHEDTMQEDTAAQEEAVLQEEADGQERAAVQEDTALQKTFIVQEIVKQEESIIEGEALTPEEFTDEKETAKQEVKHVSPEKNKEMDKENLSSIEEKNISFMEGIQENKTTNIETSESNENKNDIILQVHPVKSPLKSTNKNDTTVEVLKHDGDNANQNEEVTMIRSNEQTSENIDLKESETNSETNEDNTKNVGNETCVKIDDTEKESIQHEEEYVESMDSTSNLESIDDLKTTDIPQIKDETKDLFEEEEEEDIDINENDKTKTDDQFTETKGSVKEEDVCASDKQTEEDIDMSEIKHNKDMDVLIKEQDPNDMIRDRKRKRSPSPVEYRHESPPPILMENEPDIDDTALILSWYDSDLNLVIDKDGFFTATPMHNDGFSHMWAGARASYGFLCGKVYYEAKIVEYCSVNTEKEERPHVLRIGWSTPYTSMQLGEDKFSFGYSSIGKKLTNNQYEDYGLEFGKDDVIGCYCDATSDNVILSYTVNGKDQGTAFSISKKELGDEPLFPHILSKNCSFACNFGQETPWKEEILQDYMSIGNIESQYRIPGLRRPERKEECEVIMMCALPGCGKTTWATKYAAEHPQKMYNILGLSNLITKMKDPGQSYEEDYDGQWKILIDKCTDVLDRLIEMASRRRRNYILDQTNVYPSVQRRKMKNFSGYQRRAVVIVPSEEEYKSRTVKHKPIDGKDITDSMLLEMKANFRAPIIGESFDVVDWAGLNRGEGEKVIEQYNKEGKEAGYGEQQTSKRARTDSRTVVVHESRNDVRSNRDNRDNRDYRDRRNNYPDRTRNPVWRGGGGNMGWRDRPQRGGGHIRHGSGYGPPMPRRRRGAPIPLVHRGMHRRAGNDRRGGNDRGRALCSRQDPRSRAPIGNYQGSQQTVWNQQGNWSNQSQEGWGQQNNWGSPPWGSWKGYGQGAYNQSNYNQQGYGNGNWNSSWNQQYYNQYWGQQQQSGQTTTSSGQTTNKQ